MIYRGKLIESSASNVAMAAITFLGYGVDDEGDPKNVVSIIDQMGQILENCTPNGEFQPATRKSWSVCSESSRWPPPP